MTPVHVFGIRHHGPGSARSLVAGLDRLRPDVVLVEGPADASGLLPLAADPEMEPPVAIMVHAEAESGRALFYPFAAFSPEWQAIRWALAAGVPVRFIDLPGAVQLGLQREERGAASDAIGLLAEAAGDADPERWWERMVEQRGDGEGLFEAIREAMAAIREAEPTPVGVEARREAHMRQQIRSARRQGFERIAVVCGAWHAPVLDAEGPAAPDARLLRGLARVKVAAAWIPWTNSRLALASGYGAGVRSPGWYHHLWRAGEGVGDPITGWMTRAARLLREEDLDVSAAQVIDAVRLATALTALRDRPAPGLDEVTPAIQATLSGGLEEPMRLIGRRLVVGEGLGRIPAAAPSVPLQRDLEREQRRLRLRVEDRRRTLDLDLRDPRRLQVSHLLHRLLILGVPWGRRGEGPAGARGTFHEVWQLEWRPELALAVVEAAVWGRTVEAAARARAADRALAAGDLATLGGLLDAVVLADLPEAVDDVMRAFAERSALATDVQQLLDALPAMAGSLRYGSVRQTQRSMIAAAIEGLIARICVGLPSAAGSLDDDAARALGGGVAGADHAVGLVAGPEQTEEWLRALERVLERDGVHGQVGGRCCRILLDRRRLDAEGVARRLSAAMSRVDPAAGAAWLEGLLERGGLVLLTDDVLFGLVDEWLCGLGGDDFDALLPLVRRTFATFPDAERRQLGERVLRGRSPLPALGEGDVDPERAALVEPVLRLLLGDDDEP